MMTISQEDREIADFLAKPENLGTAYDLAGLLRQVVDEVYLRFWTDVGRLVQEGIGKRSANTWRITFYRTERNRDRPIPIDSDFIRAPWAGLKIEPSDSRNEVLSCSFAIEHSLLSSGSYRGGIYYGIRYSRVLEESDVAAVRLATTDLAGRLRNRGWAEVPERNKTEARAGDWWIGNSENVFEFFDLNGIVTLGRSEAINAVGGELQKQVGDGLLELFDAEHAAVESINKDLESQGAAASGRR
jgi:hypothetical protein